ncbi:putative membrane protein [Streptomyces sp. Ag109_O5-1]|uniref:SRPBCC family protein n=1 Tax=Streptomyces sp. Ag109_O5-1 TaxID=1938851 RepID=UPI000F505E42|nr:SRPBCC family protein [Streptomyces sp. Ag109_O5-1]RPE39940.1 putative membrane protein [Streptomyces sp. Ag109_O5-1]
MASKVHDTNHETSSGLDLLREELVDYLGAQMEHLADKAGDKLGDVTDQLLDVAENGGTLAGVGSRMLQGDSPLKAFVGQKAKRLKDNVMGKVKGIFGGGGGGKAGSTKVMNIVEVLDVGVPIRTAYNYWTQYEEFSGFTKGVRSVSKNDEVASTWKVKVGPSTRGWKASVEEQVPDERIVWSSEGAKGTTHGCVSFHELTPTLTRIVLVVEYYPSGFFEKTGNLWRAQGRRLRLDFKNFQRYVTFADEEVEGWRGEIRDGEVVRSHEEALEEEEAAGEGEEQEEYEEDDEASDDQEAEEGEEYEEEEPEDEYDEEADGNER